MNAIEKAMLALGDDFRHSANETVHIEQYVNDNPGACLEDQSFDIDFGTGHRTVADFDGSADTFDEPGRQAGSEPIALVAPPGVSARSGGQPGPEDSEPAGSGYQSPTRLLHLPDQLFKSRGMISLDSPKSQIAEEFRAIKRPLVAAIDSAELKNRQLDNVLMVTSCVEGEGKTFSALNLAMSLAMERDRTVMFIDADVVKATASKLLGMHDQHPGLTDLLMNSSIKPGEAIWHTNIANLRCISAGSASDHAAELLASDSMQALARQLSLRYPNRVIVFDAPPVLVTSEAISLAQQVGQIVFVVAAESTTQDMVADALGRLKAGARIGLLLNKTRKRIGAGYSYAYGYGPGRVKRTIEGGQSAL